jgi:1,2-diacylglycerol 3-beta-galactosyltransferase
VECNSWTLPQERFNTEWVKEKRVGVVLENFEDVVSGVKQMLEPEKLAEFKKNVAGQNNRAIFEIMEILQARLEERRTGSALENASEKARQRELLSTAG